jgi:signal transduction histidine kinase
MESLPPQFSDARVERVIASVRVALAASSLFALWLDPQEPDSYLALTYGLQGVYLAYACVLAAVMWNRDSRGSLPLVSHVGDIAMASLFQYVTLGPSSPFFTYYTFALFAAALRWGWPATVRTTAVVLAAYLAMGASMIRAVGLAQFPMNRFITRSMYLMVAALVLVYLRRHEARLRDEIRRLARWPLASAGDWAVVVPKVLEHAAGIMGSSRVTLVWSAEDEPWLYVASWPLEEAAITKHAPGEFEPVVPAALEECTFFSSDRLSSDAQWTVTRAGSQFRWSGIPVHAGLAPRADGGSVLSAPFRTDYLAGRVFFSDLASPSADIMPLAEVVGREIGASLDQLHSYDRSRRLAIAEDRIRLARDLHDGVLQSLTGVRLELQSIARTVSASPAQQAGGDRLLAMERALAMEQRDLRRFIEDLKPSTQAAAGGSLAERLDDIQRRVALEWQAPVTIRVSPSELSVQAAFDHAVPLMVHEAVVNALKHGHPSRVSVDVRAAGDALRVVVSDDGCGFSFSGRYDHAALIAANAGPVSLLERVASLGGKMAIESSPAGSRVELVLPLEALHA